MSLPDFIPSISNEIRAEIDVELKRIEADHDVKILFAVESGSRAWGFPSPNSDYDVRFVYAHKVDWYLSILPGRDVIERPISDELDISGWDIKKALGLLIKPNPVMYEWLSSPIRYRWMDDECARLLAFAEEPAHRSACLYHYLSMGRAQWKRSMGDEPTVKLKKYFYVLRPALAIRWMRLRPDDVPPMNVQALSRSLQLDDEISQLIADLIERKATMAEAEPIERIDALDRFILSEFDWAEEADKRKIPRKLRDEASDLFRNIIKGLDTV